jgi:tetratricopeptide (TPR) repeat protein
LALDRNLAIAYTVIGQAKLCLGRAEEADVAVREAIRLSPRDPWAYSWYFVGGIAAVCLGDDNGAENWLRQSIETNRNYPLTHFYLAAALANLGRIEEAKAATRTGISLSPNFTIAGFRAGASSDNPTYLAQRERVCESMRKAEVPEG